MSINIRRSSVRNFRIQRGGHNDRRLPHQRALNLLTSKGESFVEESEVQSDRRRGTIIALAPSAACSPREEIPRVHSEARPPGLSGGLNSPLLRCGTSSLCCGIHGLVCIAVDRCEAVDPSWYFHRSEFSWYSLFKMGAYHAAQGAVS